MVAEVGVHRATRSSSASKMYVDMFADEEQTDDFYAIALHAIFCKQPISK